MAEVTKEGSRVIVRPGQNVIASMTDAFRAQLKTIVHEGPKELVIDLTGVSLVDSVGIGVFITAYNSVRKAGGTFRIINVADTVMELFKNLRLVQHFNIA